MAKNFNILYMYQAGCLANDSGYRHGLRSLVNLDLDLSSAT